MENNYGPCKHCGAKTVKSPKTGKIFCSEKCWLKQDSPSKPQNAPTTGFQKPFGQSTTGQVPNATDPMIIIGDELGAINKRLDSWEKYFKEELGQ